MNILVKFFASGFLLFLGTIVLADSSDINAAARGVVRVVIMETNGQEVFPVSHGSGFAITPTKIVTNAHVIREALQDDTLRIGVVPSEGDGAVYTRAIAVNPRNDLALIEILDNNLRLPPLTISGIAVGDMSEVSAVGYPMNVDRAQGLNRSEIFQAQPPVKSRGFLSGARPSRQFDTILHTAPIARGNSGGPLLDRCGRVLGVNSFGADSTGSDAEFYFAVSNGELLPFLRANYVEPSFNTLPCRSLGDLEEAERERIDLERANARDKIRQRDVELRERRDRAELEALLSIQNQREYLMVISFILLMVTATASYVFVVSRQQGYSGRRATYSISIAFVATLGTILTWVLRPGIDAIDSRVEATLNGTENADRFENKSDDIEGTMICTIIPERSRVTGARTDDIEFDWSADGCVNTRTQFGFSAGAWTRVLVPDDEEVVSVNKYDPPTRIFISERYLLGRNDMAAVRGSRENYEVPTCELAEAAEILAEQQQTVVSLLPDRPNEKLVYSCEKKAELSTIGALALD